MPFNQFNFEHASWLWALALIPALVFVSALVSNKSFAHKKSLERFADKHLLPFLMVKDGDPKAARKGRLIAWSIIWALGVVAIAGPRWNFVEVPSFAPNKSLVILLDLSKSMDAKDVKPSRLIQAREKIQDIITDSPGISVGLVAFTEDAHVVTPITDDKRALQNVLPSLTTDLPYVQGSRLTPALNEAAELLGAMPGDQKSVLVMSDGGFEDASAITSAHNLRSEGIRVSTMGFGSNSEQKIAQRIGSGDRLPLDSSELKAVSASGGGSYFAGSESIRTIDFFKDRLSTALGKSEKNNQFTKDWEPRFYFALIPLMFLLLPLFRGSRAQRTSARHAVSGALLALLVLPQVARADSGATQPKAAVPEISKLFKNRELIGKDDMEAKDFVKAAQTFADPYRKGVASYRAGNFAEAEKSFQASKRSSVALDAQYDLGNAQAQQGKYEDAIRSYESVLKSQPAHKNAQINLKIVQGLLKKKPQQQDQKKDQDKQAGQDQKKDQDKQAGQDQKKDQDKQAGQDQKKDQDKQAGQDEKKDQGKQAGQDQKKDQGKQAGQDQKKDEGKQAGQDESDPRQTAQNSESRVGKERAQNDVDADQWLNHISNDSTSFLRNQFVIESSRRQTQNGAKPW